MERLRKRVLRDCNILDHKTSEVSSRTSSIKKTPDTNNNAKRRKTADKVSNKSTSVKKSSPSGSPIKRQTKVSDYFSSPESSSSKISRNESIALAKGEHTKAIKCKVNYLYNRDLTCPALSPFTSIGFCCQLPSVCDTLIHKNKTEEIVEDKQSLTFLVTEGIWYILPHALECVNKKVYLTPRLLRSILYGITVEKDDKVSLHLVEAFKRHMRIHPPCRKDMKNTYRSMLFDTIQVEEYTAPEIVQYDFLSIINAIEDTLKLIPDALIEENEPQATEDEEIDKEKILKKIKMASPDDLMLYFKKTYIENDNVLSLPKYKEKKLEEPSINPLTLLERLFRIFSLALNIMEADFKMWWMESCYSLREEINSPNSKPFIVQAGWGNNDDEKGSINGHCKQIFKLFTTCPKKYRQHLSRYITLCFQVAQANEVNEGLMFPYYHRLCSSFAHELACHIKDQYDISEDTVNLVQNIFPEWLKFKVCACLLDPDGSLDQGDLNSAYRIILRSLGNHKTLASTKVKPSLNLKKLKCNEKDSSGETELHKLCKTQSKNNENLLKKYLKRRATNVNIQDSSGWTPLHYAAFHNCGDCINLLIDYRLPPIVRAEKLDIHILNDDYDSPLMCAVRKGNLEAIDILLKHGAGSTVKSKNLNGETPIELASKEIKRKLLGSWKSKFITNMTSAEVDLLFLMTCSYCSAFHIKEAVIDAYHLCTKPDDIFKYNYNQYLKDNVAFENLLIIVSKLSEVPSNPKNLKKLLHFLKSC